MTFNKKLTLVKNEKDASIVSKTISTIDFNKLLEMKTTTCQWIGTLNQKYCTPLCTK